MAMVETATSQAVEAAVVADMQAVFSTAEAIDLLSSDAPTGAAGRANDRLLVRLYYVGGQYEEGVAVLDSLLAGCKDDGERAILLRELGDFRQAAGQPQQARQAYEKSLQYDSDNWMTLNNLAYLLSDQLGEYEQARPFAQRAVTSASTADTHDTLGWILVGLGDHARAAAELSLAIRLNPDDPLAYYHLGEAYRRSERLEEAAGVLQSGRTLAQSGSNADLLSRFDESLTRVADRDTTP